MQKKSFDPPRLKENEMERHEDEAINVTRERHELKILNRTDNGKTNDKK